MKGIRFTNDAETDILALHDYTKENFGPAQWVVYEQGLRTTFNDIRSNPPISADRSTVKRNLRRMIFRSHAIYYRIDVDQILILRILHLRQDPGRHV